MARTRPPAPTPVIADELELALRAAMQGGDIERLMAVEAREVPDAGEAASTIR